MSDRQNRQGEMYEKEAEKAEKEREKDEKTWEEKWRDDPVAAASWALILIWAGVVFLLQSLGIFTEMAWFDDWGLIFAGAGVIILLGAAYRLLVPAYRKPIGGTLIWAAVLFGIGLANMFGWSVIFPLVLIAIGVGILIRGLLR